MKRIKNWLVLFAVATVLFPSVVSAQKEDKNKDKDTRDKKDVQQIVITRKGDKADKVIVEIVGDKVTVNGKPAEDYKGGDVTVNTHKFKEWGSLMKGPYADAFGLSSDGENFMVEDENRAMLGVVTDRSNEGAQISELSKEGAAEKAGLKEGDIITKVDDKKIEGPDDLTRAIREHKPGDKVTITFLRNKKEQKITTELTKWKGMKWNSYNHNFNFQVPDIGVTVPRIEAMPRMRGQEWGYDERPKLGISVQDTEDGKGVKVIEVDDESNAEKAGLKEDDVITSVNDKEVNSADEVADMVRENKDKQSIRLKLLRDGKTQNIEVRMPRKLKTADL